MATLDAEEISQGQFYLERRLEPNRSLSPRGMRVVLIVIALANLFVAAFLFSVGAYPVPLFLGLDLVAVVIAFRLMEKSRQRKLEWVRVTRDHVEVTRPFPSPREAVWSSAPLFTRVHLDEVDPDAPILTLTSAGRHLEIAAGLGGEARRALAQELEDAIARARLGHREDWPN